MHRFCKSCIEESLRKTKRECPTCRKPLASHRALREDTNFDALIKLFIPDRDAFLQRERLRLQRIQEFTNPHALSESVNTGLRVCWRGFVGEDRCRGFFFFWVYAAALAPYAGTSRAGQAGEN